MDLKTPLVALAGIGPAFSSRLKNLNLKTVEDLINHYPFRYDDFSKNQNISQTKIGETVTIKGEIWSIKNIYTRYGKVLTQAVFNDGSGTIEIIWFNQPWLTKNIKTGDKLQVSGKVNRKGSKTTLVSPVWERSTPEVGVEVLKPRGLGIHTGGLIPIYPETYGLSSKWLRYKISKILPYILEKIDDPLTEFLKDEYLPLNKALKQIHFPENLDKAKEARNRLAFDELFYIQLSSQITKKEWQKLVDRLANLPISQAKSRAFSRLMLAGAMDLGLDKQGRIVLPDYLKKFAGLNKQVVLAGLYNRLEVWDAKKWEKYQVVSEKDTTDMAEGLVDLGI